MYQGFRQKEDALENLPLDVKMQRIHELMDKNKKDYRLHWIKSKERKNHIIDRVAKDRINAIVGEGLTKERVWRQEKQYAVQFDEHERTNVFFL